ncbi:hypothetical protein EXD98_18250 [Acinetobacter pittii]|uniref:Uncharacterized protein n=1 Tax=Acinetobacter pittii TaxID=48296 RepID=A0AAE8KEJ2_ACIPI|nr:DUF6527 family protein [Acinetobacter pittii]RZH25210.1 hypothetical protein EXD98_18250 [Acinetobacter pittii]
MPESLNLILLIFLIGILVILCIYHRKIWHFFFGNGQLKDIPTKTSDTGKSQQSVSLYKALILNDDADIPSPLHPHTVYIIGIKGNEWLAVFKCPCGCRAKIQLNLLPEERPRWKWKVNNNGTITLTPSVWRKVGCRSHFVMREGLIIWCE